MSDTIAKALHIMRTYPDLDDLHLFRRLAAEGIELRTAARLVLFLPLAYCRIFLAPYKVKVSADFCQLRLGGGFTPARPLTSEPLWREIVEWAQREVKRGITNDDFFAVASRSAEFGIVTEALREGCPLDTIRGYFFGNVFLGWSDDELEDLLREDETS